MKTLHESHNRKLSWYDEEQTILLVEVFAAWKWEEAVAGTELVSQVVRNHHLQPYVIYQFSSAGVIIPKSLAITNITKLIRDTLSYDGTVVFVNPNPLLKSFIDLSGLTTRVKIKFELHIVPALEDALQLVEELKQQSIKNQTPPIT
ncbi:MAG: hypothetical protein KC496_15035 [Anaerolineae bacterium]|nr:hypothetical protein [Anaerolineae bacterium]